VSGAIPGGQLRHFWLLELSAQLAYLFQRLTSAGRGLGVNQGKDGGAMFFQPGAQLVETEDFTPGFCDLAYIAAITTGHVDQPQTEVPIDTNQDDVARLHGVGEAGFHGGAAGAADRDGYLVVGLPRVTEQLLHFVHQLDKHGVEMADLWCAQCLQHARMGVGGAGAEQESGR